MAAKGRRVSLGGEDGRLAFLDDVLRTAKNCRVCLENVAGHEIVEEHPDCSEGLLHGRLRSVWLRVSMYPATTIGLT